jgi:membrane protease YdiL (CAAX protease family)
MSTDPPTAVTTPDVPWTGRDLFFVGILYFFWLYLAFALLEESGFYAWYYSPDAVALVKSSKPPEDPEKQAERRLLGTRFGLWAIALAFPFQVVTIPLALAHLANTRPQQFGLTTQRAGRNALAGLIGWALWTPVVLMLNGGVVYLYEMLVNPVPDEHSLLRLTRVALRPGERVLWFLAPMVVAPVMEEMLFRGLLQQWARARSYRVPILLLVACAAATWNRLDRFRDLTWDNGLTVFDAAAPVLYAVVVSVVVMLAWQRQPASRWPALVATALVFASIHGAWPSPLALTLLGIALGDLADRTRSLVGPIVLHSLFNGVSCVWTLLR